MLDPKALGVDVLPHLVTNLAKCRTMDEAPSGMFPDDVTFLTLTPLTPSGRKPKFPVAIHFDAYDRVPVTVGEPGVIGWSSRVELDGSGGTLSFLPDGGIGKADIGYSYGDISYGVSWRLVRGQVAVSSVRYSDKAKDVFDLKLYPK